MFGGVGGGGILSMSASACIGIRVYLANKRKFYTRPTKCQTVYYNENKTRRITVNEIKTQPIKEERNGKEKKREWKSREEPNKTGQRTTDHKVHVR